MKVSALLNVHSSPEVVLDTIDSIKTYLTDDILVVVDGASSSFNHVQLPVPKVRGFSHNVARSPYRNVALGLMQLQESYPDSDWYCYTEYDCLFTSNRILQNLEFALDNDVYMLGNDGHVDEIELPLVESIIKMRFSGSYYLLGACQFFSQKFVKKLVDINFFEKLLVATSPYTDGFFPLYQGYDVSEHMYPTLARHLGGKVGVFATYDYVLKKWHGCYDLFPIRWRPELDPDTENFPNASIMHPIKKLSHPTRIYHREKRVKLKEERGGV